MLLDLSYVVLIIYYIAIGENINDVFDIHLTGKHNSGMNFEEDVRLRPQIILCNGVEIIIMLLINYISNITIQEMI